MTIQEYLENICKHVGLTEDQFSIEIEENDEGITATLQLPDDESGLFIGYHGETLQSLQRIVRVSFYEELKDKFFRLNVNDYREQRREQLEEKIVNIAQRVQETGEPYTFSYLTAHDRYVVHTTLGDNDQFQDLLSESEGEGKQRYLTIRVKAVDETSFETDGDPNQDRDDSNQDHDDLDQDRDDLDQDRADKTEIDD